jgi:hypothetical protein
VSNTNNNFSFYQNQNMNGVKDVFEKLEKITSVEEIEPLFSGFEKFRMNDDVYPQIQFQSKKDDIEALISKGIITTEKSLSKSFEGDTLSKLLYAVLWKNGDLSKIKHIIEGILDESEEDKENGLVFHQFGKYLTKKEGEPIIDQHVLRAFGIYKANDNEDEIEQLKKLSLITKKQKRLIKDYKDWLKIGLKPELRAEKNYSYEVDKLLFAVGKSLKSK